MSTADPRRTAVARAEGARTVGAGRRPRLLRRAGIAAVVLVPVAFAGLTLAAIGDPAEGAGRVPVAIVNDDEAITQTGEDGEDTYVLAGRLLVTELTGPDSPAELDWRLTNDEDAAELLADGDVYAVLTIPEDFSAAVTSIQGDDPQQARIDIRTDDAHSYVAGPVADALGEGMVRAFGAEITEQFIVGVFDRVGGAFSESAEGAQQLAGGAEDAAAGAQEAAVGAAEFAGGVEQYAGGVAGLASGIGELEAGVQGLDDLVTGTERYTGGVAQLSAVIAQASADLQRDPLDREALGTLAYASAELEKLAGGGGSLVAGTRQAVDGVQSGVRELAAGADRLSGSGAALASGADDLAAGVGDLAAGVDGLATGTGELAAGLDEAAGQFADEGATEELAAVASEPVGYDVQTENPVDGTSGAIATTLVPWALWIGALVTFLAVPPLSRRSLASSAASGRLLLGSLTRAGIVTGVQALLLVGMLHLVAGVSWGLLPATFAFTLLTAAVFTAFHTALTVAWGRPGLIGSFLVLAVQVAAGGGALPSEALAPAFGAIAPYLPLTWATTGLQQILTTGSASVAVGACVALLLFGAASVAAAALALQRTRRAAALGLVPAT